jgi:heme-degrading monooxygenase HmoA
MAKVMGILTVEDFDNWKTVFDLGAEMRRTSGWKGTQVYRKEQNPNELIVLHEWDNEENFTAFGTSPQLMEAQKRAGVISGNHYLITSVND